MDFTAWFRAWYARHPLKEPRDAAPGRYTAEVMARVRATHQAAAAPVRSWLPVPRLVFAVAAAAAGVALAVLTVKLPGRQLAALVAEDSRVLASVGALDAEPVSGDEVKSLAEEAEAVDAFQLAESTPSDEDWLKQTLQLLDQVNEHPVGAGPSEPAARPSDENWLHDLELLDESELSASS